MDRFEGKNVVLTGAGSGIGRATAIRLTGEGAAVFAVDRSSDGLAETAKAVADKGKGRLVTHQADVSDEEAVRGSVAAAVSELGGIDVLVNNAGIHKVTPLATATLEDFENLLRVNLVGTFLFSREVLPHLPEGSGVIVNTASTSATHAHPFMTSYAATKGGVLAFTLSLAAELAPKGIRVVAVSPGGINTPLVKGTAFPEGVDFTFYSRILPQIGFGEPEAVAATIAYAGSVDGAYLTGVEVRVDGGSHN